MEGLASVRGLRDLPGFNHIADVAADHGEPLSLRGSAARRLVMHLARGKRVDHTLPAVCSPPPSDLDLLFKTDKPRRIARIVADIREKAPIFQALRVEASSVPRIENLEARLAELVHCPVLGISLAADSPLGFSDRSGTGMVELVEGKLSFGIDARANSRRPEIRFQCYVSCLVFLKVCFDRVGIRELGSQPGFQAALEFAQRSTAFAEDYVRADETLYAEHRLLDIAFSMRSQLGPAAYRRFSGLLPSTIDSQVDESRRGGSLVRFGKAQPFEPQNDWHLPSPDEKDRAGVAIDVGSASVLVVSPTLPLSKTTDDGPDFMDAIVPLGRSLTGMSRPRGGAYAAAIEVNLNAGKRRLVQWLPAYCEAHRRPTHINLRVETTAATQMAGRVDSATATVYLLGEPGRS